MTRCLLQLLEINGGKSLFFHTFEDSSKEQGYKDHLRNNPKMVELHTFESNISNSSYNNTNK